VAWLAKAEEKCGAKEKHAICIYASLGPRTASEPGIVYRSFGKPRHKVSRFAVCSAAMHHQFVVLS
jgi:hypothetical protein